MKKTVLLAPAFALFLLASCGGNDGQSKTDSAKADSTAAQKMSPEMEALAAKFKAAAGWPYRVDSLKVENMTAADSLSTAEVQLLASGTWPKHDLVNSTEWDLKSFYKIDSIKAAHGYAKYCESLDIGMTKIANAFALDKLVLDEHTTLLVWGLWTESYEACPFSRDKSVYYTVLNNGKPAGSFVLGRSMGAADAPAYMNVNITGQLEKDGSFALESFEVNNDDADENGEIHTRAHYTGAIKDGGIGPVTDKKEQPVKVKQPSGD